jgi:hypothetical protein
VDNKIYIVVADTYGGGYGLFATALYASKDRQKCEEYVESYKLRAAIYRDDSIDERNKYDKFIREIYLDEFIKVRLGEYEE